MGQKVGGYRRNVPYGKETRLVSEGWGFEVNPKGRVGWNVGTSGRKESEYGSTLNESRRLRKEREEVRASQNCVSNGLGRKGTKESGYTVYGEYRARKGGKGSESSDEKEGKEGKKKQREVALERVVMNYEREMETIVERKRRDLNELSRKEGNEWIQTELSERKTVLGGSSKRQHGDERCRVIARSGRRPVTGIRTNRITMELEGSLSQMDIMRNVESVITHHGMSSQHGRKRLGEVDKTRNQGGYYGRNVTVKGPLEGSRRTLVYTIQVGTVPRGTKRARIMESHEHAKTTYGSLGVRVTYCYGRG